MRASALALVLMLVAGCGERSTDAGADASGGAVAGGPLPTPAGTSGGSVTGMPTSPPPPAEVAVEETPAPATGTVPEGAPPADPNAIPVDPATGLAAGGPPSPGPGAPPPVQPGDPGAAGAVVREYVAALGSGAFASAQQLWSATPTDSAMLQLARGAAFAVDVLAPMRSADPAAAGVVTVPVRARGTAEDGSPRSVQATYTLRRTPEGQWRIASASVREEAPSP